MARLSALLLFVTLAGVSAVRGQPDGTSLSAQSDASLRATMQNELASLVASELSPEARAVRIEVIMKNWREAQTQRLVSQELQPVAAPTNEVALALAETRAVARSPQEAVQLTGELFRLNPELLPKPSFPDAAQGLTQSRGYLQTRSDVAAEFGDALLEARQQARTPEEAASLVEQLFKLNPQVLSQISFTSLPAR